jgi:hypothetical protein
VTKAGRAFIELWGENFAKHNVLTWATSAAR